MRPAPKLWIVPVELIGVNGSRTVHAVLDTGASATLIPPEVLVAIGCDPALSQERAGILTASGSEHLAVVRVPKIIALGHEIRELDVMAHGLPSGGSIEGLLGMDFLIQIPEFLRLDKRFRPFLV